MTKPSAVGLASVLSSPTYATTTPSGCSPWAGSAAASDGDVFGVLSPSRSSAMEVAVPRDSSPSWSMGALPRSHSAGFLSGHEAPRPRTTSSAFRRPSSVARIQQSRHVFDFHEWAQSIPDGWNRIHHAFLDEEANPAGGFHPDRGSQGMKGISRSRWVRMLRRMGFSSQMAASAMFDEIAKESRREKRGGCGELGCHPDDAEITIGQLKRFERRCLSVCGTIDARSEQSPAAMLVKLLVKHRGSSLRSWRMDFDKRGDGRVPHVDFCSACRELGVVPQGRLVWSNLRRDRVAPLELHDLDPHEAENLEDFCEALWAVFGLDLVKAWAFMDTSHQNYLSYEEFQAGASRCGFAGDIKLLYRGLDLSGLGRLRRCDLAYLLKVSRTARQRLGGAPQQAGPLAEVVSWAKRQLGDPEKLIEKLGLASDLVRPVGVGELAARLTALGFEGDSRGVAVSAAKASGGTAVTVDALLALLTGGQRRSSPTNVPSRHWAAAQKPRPPQRQQRLREQPQQAEWCDSVDDVSVRNMCASTCARKYFSPPVRL